MCSPRFLINLYKYKRKLCPTRWYTSTTCSGRPKVLFFGTDNFSLPSLRVLHKHSEGDKALGVVTSFKSPANCIRIYAGEQKLPLHKWPISVDQCKPYDLGVVVSFGHLIPTHIINAFPLGMINVHASLLPRWRGAAPIIYAIMNGDRETGVSIMRIEPKRFDVGDIFAQETVPIKSDVLMPELHKELSEKGADLLWEVIANYPRSFENPLKQNEREATYAPKVTSRITEIDWSCMTAAEIYNRYRALYSFKSLTSSFNSKSVELLDINLSDDSRDLSFISSKSHPGSLSYCKERRCLRVLCANHTLLEILRLRVEGRKAMTAMDFNNGFMKKLEKSEKLFFSNKNVVCA